jgi:hypothetical protein
MSPNCWLRLGAGLWLNQPSQIVNEEGSKEECFSTSVDA